MHSCSNFRLKINQNNLNLSAIMAKRWPDVILLVLGYLSFLTLIEGESHFDSYTYTAIVQQTNHETRSYQTCSGAWWWRRCNTHYYDYSWVTYKTATQTTQICQTGWGYLPNCDTPICNPGCTGGKVCTLPNVCSCLTTGGICSSVPCSNALNCYPGTCNSGSCTCPPGFSDANCQTFSRTPDISDCSATLYANNPESVVATASCANTGVSPIPVWLNSASPTRIEVKWNLQYNNPVSMPDRSLASYVANSPAVLGISEASFTTSFSTSARFSCAIPSTQLPQSYLSCDLNQKWSNFAVIAPVHQSSFSVNAQGTLGGWKVGANDPTIIGSSFTTQNFLGSPLIRSASFQFDLKPPMHCLSSLPSTSCLLFTIYLQNDIRTNPVVEPVFYNWTDTDSQIKNFHVDVYFMQPGIDTLLRNNGNPVKSLDVDPNLNNCLFTLTTSGVYSIELTVTDFAGNTARSRKIMIFDSQSKITLNKDAPISILESDPATGNQWITRFNLPRGGGFIPITVQWAGHFSSNAQYSSGWSNAVDAWTSGIDDKYGYQYGTRSIAAMDSMPNGIVVYTLAWVVDGMGGRGLSPTNWTSFNATIDRYALPITLLKDGDTIIVWLSANDVSGSGNDLIEKLVVNVDTTSPSVFNDTFKLKSVDEYTTSVYISVVDNASGIRQIDYTIYDATLKQSIRQGSQNGTTRDAPQDQNRRKRAVRPCTSTDTSCYCTPQLKCYNVIQEIQIDNCFIDRLAGHSFEVRYTVTNYASLTSSQQTSQLGVLNADDIKCRPAQGLSSGAIAGIIIGIILGVLILALLIFIAIIVVRVRVYKRPVPHRLQSLRNHFTAMSHSNDNEMYGEGPKETHAVRGRERSLYPPAYTPSVKVNDVAIFDNADDDDIYVYGHVQDCEIKYGEKIGEGKFATILKATIKVGKVRKDAAAKILRRGNTASDVALMKQKIKFFSSTLIPHKNLVAYMADSEDNNGQGPVLLLELCEQPLLTWLKNISTVTPDVLENMLTIVLNIAHGVEHLHTNKIIHRRLAVRNVLLVKQISGYVAKLIGFGPSAADKEENAKVPKKWLAPETLDTLRENPVYNEKTDAWSFGIVLCEIYSKGTEPYEGIKSDTVQAYVKSGQRMKRPQDLPDELFKNVVSLCWSESPSSRPTFGAICRAIDTFRSEQADQPGYYAPEAGGAASNGEPTDNNDEYDDVASSR